MALMGVTRKVISDLAKWFRSWDNGTSIESARARHRQDSGNSGFAVGAHGLFLQRHRARRNGRCHQGNCAGAPEAATVKMRLKRR